MAAARTPFPADWSLGDLLRHLGGISPDRVRLDPPPGRATEKHVIAFDAHEDRLYELIDRVLVEKAPGFAESVAAVQIGASISTFERRRELGIVTGASGPFHFAPGQVRMPDVAFTSWDRLPGRTVPDEAIPDLAPDLAIEVLSAGNTKGEMERKLKDYFSAGVRLVWYIDWRRRTAEVYTAPDQGREFTEGQALDGGDVLPGFRLPLRPVFECLTPPSGRRRNGRKKPS